MNTMAQPEQLPSLTIGDTYYLKRNKVTRQCVLRSVTFTPGFTPTAKVDYYADGELLTCRQSELLTKEQYQADLKKRRQEAYERDAPKRLSEATAKYSEVVAHWNAGRRTAKEMFETSKTCTVRGWGQMIAAAKSWKLIQEDEKP